MKKTIIIMTIISILTIGAMTAVYAADTNNTDNYGCSGSVMHQGSGNYNSMVNMMRANGFDSAAQAMENRDYAAMNEFMKNMTDEQYNKMIDMMNSNGYSGMASMMESIGREDMLEMHNSMMGNY